ncbi:MAG TPA: ferrous iron transport protein B [Mollicutes bacterium]|nr:ferrous iron transport protein B [Mollicutes bacterium]
MGLTKQSTGSHIFKNVFEKKDDNDIVIAFAGNPNTGKSTLFNNLTGLNQHTGNWPGKTVSIASGKYKYNDENYIVVDLPGTYSLLSNSVEESIARDFICFSEADVTVVVADGTCLERNLNLALQITEITNNVILCINLMDEAERKGINIDLEKLTTLLGVPVIGTDARNNVGIDDLKKAISDMEKGKVKSSIQKINYSDELENHIEELSTEIEKIKKIKKVNSRWIAIRMIDEGDSFISNLDDKLGYNLLKNKKLNDKYEIIRKKFYDKNVIKDNVVSTIIKRAESIAKQTVKYTKYNYNKTDRKIDKIITSKRYGIPIMLMLLGFIFWLTIEGANYPSSLLSNLFSFVEGKLTSLFMMIGTPKWIHNILVLGMFRTLSWVVAVMLPPMAIFFPLFTLLEDLGVLPRIAFNLDHYFKKACAHGKQALTMCMGFGCNAAGVIGCRIIDSPRERLIAIITNNFVPCNGRFPLLITLTTIFIASSGLFGSITATLVILSAIVLSVTITLFISKILSKTILKGLPSTFTLELPSYRKPQITKIITRSFMDRTLFVLGRAALIAAPAGIIIWCMANITIGGISLLSHCAMFLDPFGKAIGMDGYIIMAFILGLPANEIVLPILIMSYMAGGSMVELDNLMSIKELLVNNGWTVITAICVMLFSLNHFPCATTLLTIKKETKSTKWTLISFLIPTIVGIILCAIVANIGKLFI